jgi:N-acetylmuramoyl-L-alanine amidase
VRARFGVAGLAVLVAGLTVAAGCGGPMAVGTTPPRPVQHIDTFTYKPLESRSIPSSGSYAEKLPIPVPPLPNRGQVKPELALPVHEVAWEAAGPQRAWRWIVVHHSASPTGSAAAFDAFHRETRHWDELGYHFVIGNGTGSGDGLVEVGSRWPKQKWGAHCRVGDDETYNNFGIGVCLVGDFEKKKPTAAQMASLAKLVDYLATRYNIDDAHIIGHGTVDDTKCPGKYFSMSDLLAAVRRARSARGA